MFPKKMVPPKSSILIVFSIIFTIHFGVALFLETPIYRTSNIGPSDASTCHLSKFDSLPFSRCNGALLVEANDATLQNLVGSQGLLEGDGMNKRLVSCALGIY